MIRVGSLVPMAMAWTPFFSEKIFSKQNNARDTVCRVIHRMKNINHGDVNEELNKSMEKRSETDSTTSDTELLI